MKKIELVRVNANSPEFKKCNEMLQFFNELLNIDMNEIEISDLEDLLNQIIDFQDEDGSFKLVDSYRIESDCRVEYCHIPTYLGAAFIMKVFLFDNSLLSGREAVLANALKASMVRKLAGHGYDSTKGQIKALHIFFNAGVKEFIANRKQICSEFCEMITEIVNHYKTSLEEGKVYGGWGENYEEDFRSIVNEFYGEEEYFYVFVYGTLLMGRANYERFLSPEKPAARAEIEGYKMYDLGYFPGIIEGEGRVKGEVYKVNREKLAELDRLEGEGSLYKRVKAEVKPYEMADFDCSEVYVYVYNHNVDGCEEIPYAAQPYKNEYIWYVSYGSNMCADRLAYYIKGGYYERNGKEYYPCEADDSLPIDSTNVFVPYPMYFSNFNMGSWENSAVSFLDLNSLGESYGRAYLIKESQLKHIHKCEGSNSNWYPDLVELEEIQGIKAVTFTNKNTKKYAPMSEISAAYLSTIIDGLAEMGISANTAFEYVKECTSRVENVCWTGDDGDF